MECPKCGTQNADGVQFCTNCGANLQTQGAVEPTPAARQQTNPAQEESVGALGILFFCIPLIGAIMYFVWKDDKPKKSKQACTLAIWGVVVGIIFQVIVLLMQNM